MIAPLVLRGEPMGDESLISFVSRLSAANGLGHCRPLLERCNLRLDGFDRTDADLAVLAHVTGSSVSQLESTSFRSRPDYPRFCSLAGSPVPSSLLMKAHRRTCRACVEETGYAPALWHLKTYCACHVHERMLVDRCGRCQRPYTWGQSTVDACACGAEFGVGARAPAGALDICRRIAQMNADDKQGSPRMCGPGALSTFLWYFGGPGGSPGGIPNADPEWWAGIIELGGRMLDGWPTSFQTWVTKRYCQDPDKLVPNTDLDYALQSMRYHFDQLVPSIIEEFRSTVAANRPSIIFCKNDFWANAPSSRYMLLGRACKIVGISTTKMLRLGDAGAVRIISRSIGKRLCYAVNVEDVERIVSTHSTLLSDIEAAEILGISRFSLRLLRRAGIVKAADTVTHDPRYDALEISRFVESLSSHSVEVTTSYRCIKCGGASIVDKLRLILTGELKAVWGASPDRSLSNLFISTADARRFNGSNWETWSDPEHVPISFVATIIGVEVSAITELVSRGFLQLHGSSRGKRLRSITRESFEEFDRNYISSKRIGMAHSILTPAVSRRLLGQGIAPVVSGIPALRLPYFWKRNDLGHVDLYAPERPPPAARRSILTHEYRSVGSTARELFISRESVSGFRSAGFFGAHLPGQVGIHRQYVEAFREQYVSSSELGREYGMPPSIITRRLREIGLSPILEGQRDQRVQACWRRAEFERVDWLVIRSGKRPITPCASSPVRVAELMSARDRPTRSAEEISLAAAIEQLGTNSRSVLEAAKRGYLLVGRRNASGQIASFNASSVRQLMIDYVFNRKLSSQLGISPHATYARMQSRGFKPAIAPHNTIEGLWRRGDVEQLDDILPLI